MPPVSGYCMVLMLGISVKKILVLYVINNSWIIYYEMILNCLLNTVPNAVEFMTVSIMHICYSF